MKFFDRLLTIVATATVTSMFWIVAGGSLMETAGGERAKEVARPAEAAPSPTPTPVAVPDNRVPQPGESAQVLDVETASRPGSDDEGQGRLLVPVLNVRPSDLSDTFTDARGGAERLHEAIDIMAPEGTSVIAAAPGTVEKLFRSKAGGNTIYIRSNDGETIHYYAHLAEYAQGLQEGQRIRRGQRLGTVGSSGNADPQAPHLHFAIMRTTADAEWWEPANALNPYPLLTADR